MKVKVGFPRDQCPEFKLKKDAFGDGERQDREELLPK